MSKVNGYGNDFKFLDRQVWANSVNLDKTAKEQSDQGHTVCHSVCIFRKSLGLYQQYLRVSGLNFSAFCSSEHAVKI